MKRTGLQTYAGYSYPLFRIVFGLLFFTHGASKILPFMGGSMSVTSQMGFFGLMEVIVGLTIAIGLFTRLAALGGIVMMILAYYKSHLPQGLLPPANGGELAVIFAFAFYLMMKYGSGMWSFEKEFFGKERF